MRFKRNPQFRKGDKAVSLVYHPPEIKSGTEVTIISPHFGTIYAVELPDGKLHRWIADFELRSLNTKHHRLKAGDSAIVLNDTGHHGINKGMVVKIVKPIIDYFYDVRLPDESYHRWSAELELAYPV